MTYSTPAPLDRAVSGEFRIASTRFGRVVLCATVTQPAGSSVRDAYVQQALRRSDRLIPTSAPVPVTLSAPDDDWHEPSAFGAVLDEVWSVVQARLDANDPVMHALYAVPSKQTLQQLARPPQR